MRSQGVTESSHLKSALSILHSLHGKEPDTGVEAEHEDGPDGGPGGDAVLLEVGPGPAHHALPILADLLQQPLHLVQVSEGGGPVSVSKKQVVSSEYKYILLGTAESLVNTSGQWPGPCWGAREVVRDITGVRWAAVVRLGVGVTGGHSIPNTDHTHLSAVYITARNRFRTVAQLQS